MKNYLTDSKSIHCKEILSADIWMLSCNRNLDVVFSTGLPFGGELMK